MAAAASVVVAMGVERESSGGLAKLGAKFGEDDRTLLPRLKEDSIFSLKNFFSLKCDNIPSAAEDEEEAV